MVLAEEADLTPLEVIDSRTVMSGGLRWVWVHAAGGADDVDGNDFGSLKIGEVEPAAVACPEIPMVSVSNLGARAVVRQNLDRAYGHTLWSMVEWVGRLERVPAVLGSAANRLWAAKIVRRWIAAFVQGGYHCLARRDWRHSGQHGHSHRLSAHWAVEVLVYRTLKRQCHRSLEVLVAQ